MCGNGGYVACSNNIENSNGWNKYTVGSSAWNSITYANGYYVMGGFSGSVAYLQFSGSVTVSYDTSTNTLTFSSDITSPNISQIEDNLSTLIDKTENITNEPETTVFNNIAINDSIYSAKVNNLCY